MRKRKEKSKQKIIPGETLYYENGKKEENYFCLCRLLKNRLKLLHTRELSKSSFTFIKCNKVVWIFYSLTSPSKQFTSLARSSWKITQFKFLEITLSNHKSLFTSFCCMLFSFLWKDAPRRHSSTKIHYLFKNICVISSKSCLKFFDY